MKSLKDIKIGVIGLGYVGLPLAVEFSLQYQTFGYDINPERITQLQSGFDKTLELSSEELKSGKLKLSNKIIDLCHCNVYIITVPTPIDKSRKPDFSFLINASKDIGKILKPWDIVIYESTVYPGATEEICVPILEKFSKLKFNEDFFCGYSPERINPGDNKHRLVDIIKVTSGSTPKAAIFVDELYQSIITAGTHSVSSIKVAEAAKVIENTQRDVNIALINEFSIIFNKLGIDTGEILEAAKSKWNFLDFKPGLVGGHCIGVDPYYLTYKAQLMGYDPEIILSGRRLNDNMSKYIASQMLKCLNQKKISLDNTKILILGITFKENCPDMRNSKVFDLIIELEKFGILVDCMDPWADPLEAETKYGRRIESQPPKNKYDGIILAVAHNEFKKLGIDKIKSYAASNHVFYDLKHLFSNRDSDLRL